MKTLVFDTSALFNFGKRGELEFLLEKLAEQQILLITPEVALETLEPENRVYYQKLVKKHFKLQKIEDVKVSLEELRHLVATLGRGELSVILIAMELNATAVLDDRVARQEAERLNVKLTGTLGILSESVTRGWCSDSQCIEILNRLHANKFRIRKPAEDETFSQYISSLS